MKTEFLPSGTVLEPKQGETLLCAAARAGIRIAADCAGAGRCGACRVRLVSGTLSPVCDEEKRVLDAHMLREGWRLACRAEPLSDCRVFVPSGRESTDKGRLRFPADFAAGPCGDACVSLAFDIGTTTVAGFLCDALTGDVLAAASRTNPQGTHGADVISRIEFCMNEADGLQTLQTAVHDVMADIAGELFHKTGVYGKSVSRVFAAGNTTMTHILLGVDPSGLARAPFTPAFLEHAPVPFTLNGLLGSEAGLLTLSNIASHVGADITAALLCSRLCETRGSAMLIDIGTNGEMAFYADGKLLVCSTAAGPAFEGACISCGMRASSGAICALELKDADIRLEVCENAQPSGVCGSGLIDAVALMADTGVVDASGKLLSPDAARSAGVPEALCSRIRGEGRSRRFVLFEADGREVAVTQRDVREVQLAKAAIAAGAKLVMRELGVGTRKLDAAMIAGAFGSGISVKSALRLGLVPNVAPEKVVRLGNAAGAGVCMAAMNESELEKARDIAGAAKHVELASHPDFQNEFIKAMRF